MKLRWVSIVLCFLVAAAAGAGYWQTRISAPFKTVFQSCLDTDVFDGRPHVNSHEAYMVCMTAARIQASTWKDRSALTHFARSFEIVNRASVEMGAESPVSFKYFEEHKVLFDSTPDGRKIGEHHRQEMLAARSELNATRAMVGLRMLPPLYGEPGFTQN